MGKVLVIGSTVCDVVIYVDQLPTRQGDEHIRQQFWSLGGCAFNVAHLLHRLEIPYTFLSPIGSGQYGQFVRESLEQLGMSSDIHSELPNGCCYCFVESDGERTFLSEHGVEYRFDSKWLDGLDLDSYDYIYVCGLEVEEETGDILVDALSAFTGQLVFAPGPRGHLIPKDRLEKLFGYSPIVHLNQQELLALSEEKDRQSALSVLAKRTQNTLVVTQGNEGAILYDGKDIFEAPAYPAKVLDTIGAGDSHVSAYIASLVAGRTPQEALRFANQVASRIVTVSGVHLSTESYAELKQVL